MAPDLMRRSVRVALGITLCLGMGLATNPVSARGPLPAGVGSLPSGIPAPGVALESVLSDYDRPVYVTSDHGNKRLFVVEQAGKIRVATRTSTTAPWVKAGTFLNLSSIVHDPNVDNEQGLLGLAFHPDYGSNGLFYVYYTRESDDKDVLAEYHKTSATKADPASARVVMATTDPAPNHNGGWIAFGPGDYLYVAMGDGGGSPDGRPQDLDSRHGKMLRIDPLDRPGSARFSNPSDNPYVGIAGNDSVWALGLRNPWRDSFDRLTGDLWVGDVGQVRYEEVTHVVAPDAGENVNFGWDQCEGRHAYPGSGACTDGATMLPQVEYPHSVTGEDNCAVTGGYVYRGADQPSLAGLYFFGDYCSGRLWAIPTDFDMGDGDVLPTPLDSGLNISSFGEDSRGEVYVVSISGSIWHLVED
ncbi:MAG: PQQ-dependent sugar dehydrogenase [Candidatus Limnocylindrales bacterium]